MIIFWMMVVVVVVIFKRIYLEFKKKEEILAPEKNQKFGLFGFDSTVDDDEIWITTTTSGSSK